MIATRDARVTGVRVGCGLGRVDRRQPAPREAPSAGQAKRLSPLVVERVDERRQCVGDVGLVDVALQLGAQNFETYVR